jgi:hypothetical protein
MLRAEMRFKVWIGLAVAGVATCAVAAAPPGAGSMISGSPRPSGAPGGLGGPAGPDSPADPGDPSAAVATPMTRHLIDAQRLVDHLATGKPNPRNTYLGPGQRAELVWGGHGHGYRARAQCASFVVMLLKHSYQSWANASFFKAHFGAPAPSARSLYRALTGSAVPHFRRINNIGDLRQGDMLFIDYQNDALTADDSDVPSGHAAIIRNIEGVYLDSDDKPGGTVRGVQPGMIQYAVQLIDTTRSPHGNPSVPGYEHYPDTRIFRRGVAKGDGAGYGFIILYADARTGKLAGYRWSPTDPNAHLSDHPLVAVRVTAD